MVRCAIFFLKKPMLSYPNWAETALIYLFLGKFHIHCSLGDCGMTVSTNDDGSELTYAIQIGTSRFG